MANSSKSRQPAASRPPLGTKRRRSDYEMLSGHDMSRYNVHENDWGRDHLNVVYDMPNRYVMPTYYAHQDDRGHFVNMQHGSSYYPREDYWGGRHVDTQYDHQLPSGSSFATIGVGGGRAQIPLPPGDCNTLFVEGLPAECVHGEKYLVFFLIYSLFCFPLLVFFPSLRFADMFRPFLGYKDVRLIRRESRQPGAEPVSQNTLDNISMIVSKCEAYP